MRQVTRPGIIGQPPPNVSDTATRSDLGLLEVKLGQFFDLQDLAEGDEQTVLLKLAVVQKNLTRAGQSIRISRLSRRFEFSFQFALHHPFGAACL